MPGSPQARRLRGVALLAAVVGVGAGALTAASADRLSDDRSRTDVADEALAAARQVAVDFSSYDYRHLAEDFKHVADESVGRFHADFLKQSTGVQDLIVKAKAVTTAQAASAAVVSSSPRQATVLVAVTRTLQSKGHDPQTESYGLEITVVRQGGRWLASDLKTQ